MPTIFHYCNQMYGESFSVLANSKADADRYLREWLDMQIRNGTSDFERKYYVKPINDAIEGRNYEMEMLKEGSVLVTEQY